MLRLGQCVFSTFLLVALTGTAEACSCARPGDRAPVAFEGDVITTEPLAGVPRILKVTIRVSAVHRGDVPPVVTVHSYAHDFLCGAGEYIQKAQAEGRSLRFDVVSRANGSGQAPGLQDGSTMITFCEVR